MDFSSCHLAEDPEFAGLPENEKLQHYLTEVLAMRADDGTGLEFFAEELNTEGGIASQTDSRNGAPLVTGFNVHPNSAATEGLPSFAVRVCEYEAFRDREGPDRPGRIWHITVNWASEGPLEDELSKFRSTHAGVSFIPDPDWTSGPGSDQHPRVKIASGSLPAIQSAIRAFALGGALHDRSLSSLEESWQMNPQTGYIDTCEFTWEVNSRRIGTDVFNAVEEHGN